MSELLETFEEGVLTLTINRPKARNTVNQSVSDALQDALHRAEPNPDVRCVVLTGAGGIFSAGGDVSVMASGEQFASDDDDPEAALVEAIRDGGEVSRLLYEIPKPTLAVISGVAAGFGLSLALACDLRFCLDTARLTTAFTKVGISGDGGISYFLEYLVGPAKARELYFTSEVITGQEAFEMGLVTKVAPQETFEEESQSYAKTIASLPTVALGCIKANLIAARHSTLGDVLQLEAENVVRTMLTDDHKQAAAAFLDKRTPIFQGR